MLVLPDARYSPAAARLANQPGALDHPRGPSMRKPPQRSTKPSATQLPMLYRTGHDLAAPAKRDLIVPDAV